MMGDTINSDLNFEWLSVAKHVDCDKLRLSNFWNVAQDCAYISSFVTPAITQLSSYLNSTPSSSVCWIYSVDFSCIANLIACHAIGKSATYEVWKYTFMRYLAALSLKSFNVDVNSSRSFENLNGLKMLLDDKYCCSSIKTIAHASYYILFPFWIS